MRKVCRGRDDGACNLSLYDTRKGHADEHSTSALSASLPFLQPSDMSFND